MSFLRASECAPKWAFLFFRRDDVTSAEYFIFTIICRVFDQPPLSLLRLCLYDDVFVFRCREVGCCIFVLVSTRFFSKEREEVNCAYSARSFDTPSRYLWHVRRAVRTSLHFLTKHTLALSQRILVTPVPGRLLSFDGPCV